MFCVFTDYEGNSKRAWCIPPNVGETVILDGSLFRVETRLLVITGDEMPEYRLKVNRLGTLSNGD